MKMCLKLIASTLGFGMLMALAPAAAQAADLPLPSGALKAVERAVGTSTTMNESVALPARAGQAVRINGHAAGAQLEILPALSGSRAAVTEGGTTVVSDATRSVAVQPLPDGVRLMSVLADSSSPTSTTFRVSLPAGESLRLDVLGGVLVLRDGKAVGRFNAPWAVDAAQNSLPTSYTVTGDAITQTVDTRGAQFPVVADPHYTWGWVTGTVFFNKSETTKMAASAAFVAALGAFLPPPFDILVVASAGIIALKAGFALADNACIAVVSNGDIHEYSGNAGDGYCR